MDKYLKSVGTVTAAIFLFLVQVQPASAGSVAFGNAPIIQGDEGVDDIAPDWHDWIDWGDGISPDWGAAVEDIAPDWHDWIDWGD